MMVHVRIDGTSKDLDLVGLDSASSDGAIREAAAQAMDVALDHFDSSVIDRTGTVPVIRPEAVYG